MAEVGATYRVQLHAGFTFDDAASLAGYLADLGVTHLYCSPYLQAAPGSTHGYDVVDHHRLNDELGGEAGHGRLVAALRGHGLGHVLDIVPNHMAVAGRANAWWWDVLENGPSSRYASYFDIDWDPPERKLIAQVLVPVLGDHYGRVLEAGELQLGREGGAFLVRSFDLEVPVSPRTLDDLVGRAAERVGSDELASVAHALGRLPHALSTDRASVIERHRDKEVLRQRLAALCEEQPEIAVAIDEEVKAINEDADALDSLLNRQNYRLAYWRTAGRELDYRRFFDITSLVALRTEEEDVFADTHELVLSLVAGGVLDGLRIDHVDGLRDPEAYLHRLREAVGPSTYVVVEKILEGEERLPPSWPVDGTSGYDFLAQVNALLHAPMADDDAFASVARAAKHEAMRSSLAADIERLTELFVVVAERDRRHRDYTRPELRDALREVIAEFAVYRTYVHRDRGPTADDCRVVEGAAGRAMERRPDLEPELFRFLADVLLLRRPGEAEAELAERFQQVSAPVMAKAVEDTAFYRYLRLVSLNEVGGDPGRSSLDVASFHQRRIEDAARGARSLLATSTHDTKRSEDVRARLAVLSEIPEAWAAAVSSFFAHNARHRPAVLDRPTEELLYQTVVGAWPLPADRLRAYMEKATKEAKVHTSWVDPVPEYDSAVGAFAEAVLADAGFVSMVESFLDSSGLVEAGRRNSLLQVALKLTSPGVPDIYQGTEVWDLSLVDPDNRRPVDYPSRRRLLADPDVLDRVDEGGPKLWLISRLLKLRAERPWLFDASAGYEPLAVTGPGADRVIAFVRGSGLAVVGVRFPTRGPLDPSTHVALPEGNWRQVVDLFPVSIYVRDAE
jgi:(1->4)-alpha-D-glucan 1-alpha-D-glucosylmutase